MPQTDGTTAQRPRNQILAALPEHELEQLRSDLEKVRLEPRQLLFDYDQPIEHAYFPEDAVGSILGVMEDGSAVETATVGHEGMVGLPLFLGVDRTAAQAFVQVPGEGWRISRQAFQDALRRSEMLRNVLGRYTQALFILVGQSSACNRIHVVNQRCARWLLMTHDRVGADVFSLTHQFLAQMLGVRRATVTEAMGALQEKGCIEYRHGRITVHDRSALEAEACECYAIIAREFAERLGGKRGSPHPLEGVQLSEEGHSTPTEPGGELPTVAEERQWS